MRVYDERSVIVSGAPGDISVPVALMIRAMIGDDAAETVAADVASVTIRYTAQSVGSAVECAARLDAMVGRVWGCEIGAQV